MSKHALAGLIMATLTEAKPFINGLALVQKKNTPFPVFTSDELLLVICGIGKVNAAMGTAYCCLVFNPSVVINLGSAGATDHSSSVGNIFHVSKIYEFDRPNFSSGEPHMTQPETLEKFDLATLATQDKPIVLPEERQNVSRLARLVDMEAAGIVQTCQKFDVKCMVFKYVSDTPDHTEGKDIFSNIKEYRDPFYTFFSQKVLPKIRN